MGGDERAAKKLCDECLQIAVSYLRMKSKRNNFLLQYLYKDIEDLALDCIADLFAREEGIFVQFESYFESDDIINLTEGEIFSKIRRLVFSKVNEGIYRNYQKFDPSLSKIIRNLKRSIEEQKVKGVLYNIASGEIIFSNKESSKPIMAEEILEIKLSSYTSQIFNTIEALESLKLILQTDEYASKFQLVGFAVILRKVFAHKLEVETAFYESSSDFKVRELSLFIDKSITKQAEFLKKTYVTTGKMDLYVFERYMNVISEILKSDFIEHSKNESYYEHFNMFFPDVSYEKYRDENRKVLEYLVKKVREQLIVYIKKEENFSTIKVWK